MPSSPGFGDFVSVPPSADPLALGVDFATPVAEQPFDSHFVQSAKARTAEKERQMMDEFRQSEGADPLGLLPERNIDILSDLEPEEQTIAQPVEQSTAQPALLRNSSELKRTESAPSLLAMNESALVPPELTPSAASASPSPMLGLSGRLSLPRWTSLLSSSLPTLPPTTSVLRPEHTPPTHSPELPHGKPVRESSITHDNPFAHVFSPPSGAPGYTGEKWDKGFEEDGVTSKSSSSRLKLVGRTEMTTPILTTETAEKVGPQHYGPR